MQNLLQGISAKPVPDAHRGTACSATESTPAQGFQAPWPGTFHGHGRAQRAMAARFMQHWQRVNRRVRYQPPPSARNTLGTTRVSGNECNHSGAFQATWSRTMTAMSQGASVIHTEKVLGRQGPMLAPPQAARQRHKPDRCPDTATFLDQAGSLAGPQGTMAARSRPRTRPSADAGLWGIMLFLGSSRISCVRPSFQRLRAQRVTQRLRCVKSITYATVSAHVTLHFCRLTGTLCPGEPTDSEVKAVQTAL